MNIPDPEGFQQTSEPIPSMAVQVDLTKCVGFGQCCFAAPDVFWMKGQEVLEYSAVVGADRADQVTAAAAACPVQAITLGRIASPGAVRMARPKTGPRVVVVGASLAGLRAAEAVSLADPDAQLILVDAEATPAYDRPPLSKGFLTGKLNRENVQLASFRNFSADWKLGQQAVRLDRPIRSVLLSSGEPLLYDRLIIATGAHARPWPQPNVVDLPGVISLRSASDAETLRAALERRPKRVCIIGAGFIGTEIASTCRELELDVTVLERAEIPLLRALGRPVGRAFAEISRRNGVDLRLGVEVKSIHAAPDGSRVAGVELSDGERIDCEVLVIALGAVRNTSWLAGAGLKIDDRGLATDHHCRVLDESGAALNDIYAAGDVTTWPSQLFDDERLAVEHWSNALDQGRCAGRNAVSSQGLSEHDYLPTFWSSQFGLNIKSAGIPGLADSFQVTQGSLESGSFAGIYGRNGRTVAAVTIDHGRHLTFYADLVRARAPFPQALSPATGPLHLSR